MPTTSSPRGRGRDGFLRAAGPQVLEPELLQTTEVRTKRRMRKRAGKKKTSSVRCLQDGGGGGGGGHALAGFRPAPSPRRVLAWGRRARRGAESGAAGVCRIRYPRCFLSLLDPTAVEVVQLPSDGVVVVVAPSLCRLGGSAAGWKRTPGVRTLTRCSFGAGQAEPETVDLAVVGGGVMGVWAAIRGAEQGASVVSCPANHLS